MLRRRVGGFVIDAETSRGPRSGELVDRDPSQDLVGGPGAVVRPVVEFFVDPGEQASGAGGEGVAEGLRFGGLLGAVAGAFF